MYINTFFFCIKQVKKSTIYVVIRMEAQEKREKQLQLAKLFYEMGMEEEVILKISGIEKKEYLNIKNKEDKLVDKTK